MPRRIPGLVKRFKHGIYQSVGLIGYGLLALGVVIALSRQGTQTEDLRAVSDKNSEAIIQVCKTAETILHLDAFFLNIARIEDPSNTPRENEQRRDFLILVEADVKTLEEVEKACESLIDSNVQPGG